MSVTHRQRGRRLPWSFQHPQQRHIPLGRAAKHRASSESSGVTMATPVHNWVHKHKRTAGLGHFLSWLWRRVTSSIHYTCLPHSLACALTGQRVLRGSNVHVVSGNPQSLQTLLTQSRRNSPKMSNDEPEHMQKRFFFPRPNLSVRCLSPVPKF